MTSLHIGFDDTDSSRGFCTTFIGAKITKFLLERNIPFLDYPLLIRLNPNVPFKTRGNGAVCIRVKINIDILENLISEIMSIFREFTDFNSPTTNPGIVFWVGELDEELKILSKRALYTIIPLQSIKNLINSPKAKVFGFNNKQGLIGSFSAIGTTLLDSDYTFELLTYRNPSIRNSNRKENTKRIWEVIHKNDSYLDTFSNADIRNKALKIIPHGPDPVFCGIRGKTTQGLIAFWKEIQPQPKPELSFIFRTNQGTDAHFTASRKRRTNILEKDFSHFETIFLEGTVSSIPKWDIGGHLSFDVKFKSKIIPCFAYEPTKEFRTKVSKLIIGDEIIVGGNIRPPTDIYPLCINLEKIEIKTLSENSIKLNPYCPTCKKRLKSMGKDQGFRCNKCRKKYNVPPLSFLYIYFHHSNLNHQNIK